MPVVKPSKTQIANGTYKIVDGTWHKLCTGPAHEEPEYLPATDKYFYVHKSGAMEGKLTPRCRLCANWDKLKSPGSHHGWIAVEKVHPYYTEAINRIGQAELQRRSGLSAGHIRSVVNKRQKYVKKAQLRRLMLELTSIRRKNEYSISNGSKWRRDKRNDDDRETCAGCGTLKVNYTRGCDNCWNRLNYLYRSKKITKKQYEQTKKEIA